jgi:quercetin dioxygenase-like cupin family protein
LSAGEYMPFKSRKRFLLGLGLSAIVAFALLAQDARRPAHEEHAGKAPGSLEFENDKVQVLRVHVAPHATIPMHDITERVVIWLTPANLKVTLPDGTSKELHIKAGEAAWAEPGRHAGTNLSDQPIEFIAVVPKDHHQ